MAPARSSDNENKPDETEQPQRAPSAQCSPIAFSPVALGSECDKLTEEMKKISCKLDRVLQQKQEVLKLQPVVIRIEYLPDYSEEYSIRVTPGLGQAELNVKLENGWNLNAVNSKTDQEYDKIIGAFASLVGAIMSPVPGKDDRGKTTGHAESNVPLGYYEAVIARNEMGCKEMMGWRDVGFMPFTACPVKAEVYRNTITCDDQCLCALVFTGGTLRMKRIDTMSCDCQHHANTPSSECPDAYAPRLQDAEFVPRGLVSQRLPRVKELAPARR